MPDLANLRAMFIIIGSDLCSERTVRGSEHNKTTPAIYQNQNLWAIGPTTEAHPTRPLSNSFQGREKLLCAISNITYYLSERRTRDVIEEQEATK